MLILCIYIQNCKLFIELEIPNMQVHQNYILLAPVVRKVDSAIHRIVSFSTAAERHNKQ